MIEYGRVKVAGPKVARKLELQHDALVRAMEEARIELSGSMVGSVEYETARIAADACMTALVSVRAQLMGVTVEWFKQSYC